MSADLKAFGDDERGMAWLAQLFRPHRMTEEERQREGARLDARRKHLRGKMSRTQGEIRRAWTAFRTWRGEPAGKKKLRVHIRSLEAERKAQVKEMLALQANMKKIGYNAAAGHVEVS